MVPMYVCWLRKPYIAALVLGVLLLIGILLATDLFDWRLVPNPTPNRY